MEIKVTNDYTLFKKLEGNRDVRKKNALVRSIKEMDLTMYSPIIVSEDFRIIDGQHRFEACKELGLPIYFLVMPSKNAERAMIVLNRCQSQWKSEEFFHYKTIKVGGCYSELEDYMKRYGMAIAYAVILFPKKEFETKKVKLDGFTFEKGEHAEELAEFWSNDAFRPLPFRINKAFIRAIRYFFEESTPRQREKLLRKALCIPVCANYSQYLTAFENLVKMRR